ncbi:MAG: sugar transferase [Bacteroidetes bacterium]|nr:sugar transferase [Bacteroidota bacterium]
MDRDLIIRELGNDAADFIERFTDIHTESTHLLKTLDNFNIEAIDDKGCKAIVNLSKINDIKSISSFFKVTNSKLPVGGIFIGCVETHIQRKYRLLHKFPFLIAQIYFLFDFIFKRVFPKFFMTRWLYYFITAGRNRVISKAEALGKLVFCGFDIVEVAEIKNLTFFVGRKTLRPIPEKHPSFGFFFKMKRVGKNNKIITVYKIRTMHPYAEYLQEYIYEQNKLQDGGKFKDDFRITSWGKFFRKFWIDELPMIVNLLKGEIKLVGVRPLSEHYLSLYTDELKQKRVKAKPGLVPPFYADMPVSLDDIMLSELRYLEAYQLQPLRTDCRYFMKAFNNIVFKKARTN